jgi:glycosyltransferase involved in cell wall biosynthesis
MFFHDRDDIIETDALKMEPKMAEKDPLLTILVPVYNEKKSIAAMHTALKNIVNTCGVDAEILYVDDGSTDGSAEILEGMDARVIHHDFNMGYGAAVKTGIQHCSSEFIAMIDCDGTYDPGELVRLFNDVRTRDLVIGQRPKEKGFRALAKWILNGVASYAVSCPIPDLNSGFRVFRRSLALRLFSLLPNGFSLTSTMTVGALFVPYRVKFVPVTYKKRVGVSKIKPIRALRDFFFLIIRTMILFNPLKFFIPASMAVGGVGLVFLVRDIIDSNIAQTSLLMITNAFILLAIGLLAEAIRRPD